MLAGSPSVADRLSREPVLLGHWTSSHLPLGWKTEQWPRTEHRVQVKLGELEWGAGLHPYGYPVVVLYHGFTRRYHYGNLGRRHMGFLDYCFNCISIYDYLNIKQLQNTRSHNPNWDPDEPSALQISLKILLEVISVGPSECKYVNTHEQNINRFALWFSLPYFHSTFLQKSPSKHLCFWDTPAAAGSACETLLSSTHTS